MLEQLEEMIQNEVNKRVANITEELSTTKIQLQETLVQLQNNINLNKEYQDKELQYEMLNKFKSYVNTNNFSSILDYFKLKRTDIRINGMFSESIPLWFKLLITYYDDKENLISLMNLFGIKYPEYIHKIKLPYDYNEKELDIIFKNIKKMYVCNGCIFDGNIGFWYREMSIYKFDFDLLFQKSSYVEIPWQLFLKNKLLTTEKYFNKIMSVINKKESHSNYFFAIQRYQQLTDQQRFKLAKLLPKDNMWDVHLTFIEENKDILIKETDLVEKFKDKINDNKYSTFYYLNFPIGMQKEFIEEYYRNNKNNGYKYSEIVELIKPMKISQKEKSEFLNVFTEKEFE